MGGFGFVTVLPRVRPSCRSPGAVGFPEQVGGVVPPGRRGEPLVEGGRRAVKRFRPARSRTGVVVGSAFGPVVRSVDVSNAGRSRLAVIVIGRVFPGFVFVPVFVS